MSYHFGSGSGAVPPLVEQAVCLIAARHEAVFIAFRPDHEPPRYWFSCANYGAPFDAATRDAVLADLEEAELWEDGALVLPDPDPWGEGPGQSAMPLAELERRAQTVIDSEQRRETV